MRSWPGSLGAFWRSVVYHWHTRDKGNLVFISALILPTIALAVAIYFFIAEKNRNRELTCLALNIYHEARGEPMAGQFAIAEVTMNRVASKHYPNTICEVVYQKNWDQIRRRYVSAFSWTELDTSGERKREAWGRASEAAEAVYFERQVPRLKGALFYHNRNIKPSWARKKKPVATNGKHVFYK